MMSGANEVLREAGCALVGGHTSEGAELSLGFSVNGLVARARALRKGGLQPGDALILTKPIGTGTLLAADMRGKAKARWVAAAVEHMTISNRPAAAILRRHGVHAATDVTGFGLLGHLVEMVRASGVDASLAVAAVPLLDGARETLARGIFSSLQPQNVRLRRAIRNLEEAAQAPALPHAVRSADGRRPSRLRAARAGRTVRRGASRGRLCRGCDHRLRRRAAPRSSRSFST